MNLNITDWRACNLMILYSLLYFILCRELFQTLFNDYKTSISNTIHVLFSLEQHNAVSQGTQFALKGTA